MALPSPLPRLRNHPLTRDRLPGVAPQAPHLLAVCLAAALHHKRPSLSASLSILFRESLTIVPLWSGYPSASRQLMASKNPQPDLFPRQVHASPPTLGFTDIFRN
ncbi:hypothetical protein E2C01_052959 [Portunus trituberculatus]|uniref:Uncharacterized protein n=1 Tax=Portunus trituberculatus TaxID=210409 RepID=A0A5B7GN87_PORTR|nr:hypothetical protein [Portunus trituberculatus]